MKPRPLWTGLAASILILIGIFMNFAEAFYTNAMGAISTLVLPLAIIGFVFALFGTLWFAVALLPIGLFGAYWTVVSLMTLETSGTFGYWALLWGFLLLAAFGVGRVSLSEETPQTSHLEKKIKAILPPLLIPFVLLLIWQGLTTGFQVPKGIFPSVVDVWIALTATIEVLLRDSYITFVKEVLFGFVIGVIAGFLVGVAVALSVFLQRGFLPLAAAFGAIPIVGLAPVLGRAFGVDWESKAAVVVITTFFPVVLNTVQGLVSVDALKLELLKAYAAKPIEIFLKLRLPNALPYIFNALKLAAVVSIISVIVSEFLIPGPPEGLGQRISLSARRGAYDIVFAAIVVSSFISIAFYGFLSFIERRMTGWHSSFREEQV